MRKIVILGFAAGLLAAALPASAANSNSNANNANRSEANARDSQPQANGAADPNRRICVREPRSESHIRREICHTAREWRDLQGNEDLQG